MTEGHKRPAEMGQKYGTEKQKMKIAREQKPRSVQIKAMKQPLCYRLGVITMFGHCMYLIACRTSGLDDITTRNVINMDPNPYKLS